MQGRRKICLLALARRSEDLGHESDALFVEDPNHGGMLKEGGEGDLTEVWWLEAGEVHQVDMGSS